MAEDKSASVQAEGADLIGQTLERRYLVEKIIGQGGFGTVYSATHAHTRDKLAIKVLRSTVASDPTVVERFRREATLTSQLKHPNTVSVIDFGEMDDGRLYLVMPFLEGRTLTDLLRDEGPIEPERLVPIAVQVLKSLDEAHSKGMVHRDLKPDNIFLQDLHGEADFVRVLDFGIARSLDSKDQDLTTAGTVMGTPKYMSPEQATGKKADARADLYALGVILYEALSGLTPLLGDTPLATIFRRATEDAPDVRGHVLLPTPQGLCAAVLKAMARDPANRFASAAEMTRALEAGLKTSIQLPAHTRPMGGAQLVASTMQYRGADDDTFAVDLSPPPPPPPPQSAAALPSKLRTVPASHEQPPRTNIGNAPAMPMPPKGRPPVARAPVVQAPTTRPAARSTAAPRKPPPPPPRSAAGKIPVVASTATATPTPTPKTSSKAPLIAAVLLLILGSAGAAVWLLSGGPAASSTAGEAGTEPAATSTAAVPPSGDNATKQGAGVPAKQAGGAEPAGDEAAAVKVDDPAGDRVSGDETPSQAAAEAAPVPADPADPAGAADPADPAGAADPADPAGAADPGEPGEPGDSAEVRGSDDPAGGALGAAPAEQPNDPAVVAPGPADPPSAVMAKPAKAKKRRRPRRPRRPRRKVYRPGHGVSRPGR